LLLHDGAWGGSSDVTWGTCIPALAAHYRVIAPDFLGFGGSDKATYFDRSSYEPRIAQLESLLDVLNIDSQVHVVGSSFGGSVALRWLAVRSERLRSVTSIGGSGGPWKTDFMKEQLGRWDGSRFDLARILLLLMDQTDDFDAQLSLRQHFATMPGHYRALASAAMPIPEILRNDNVDAWPEPLKGIKTPTLLIAGQRDDLFEHEWPDRIARVLPNAQVVRPDCRHSPNLDSPGETTSTLLGFLSNV
jgi:pimeloyl-ACP methyl ester carboxylesterase